jgi:predicted nucleic acid-binding protein
LASVYVDTSALGRIMVEEPDRRAIERALEGFDHVVSSRLLRTELCRLGLRRDLPAERAEALLSGIALMPLDEELLGATERLPPAALGTLDTIHLATALRLGEAGELDALMTYDRSLERAGREHGLAVLSPI